MREKKVKTLHLPQFVVDTFLYFFVVKSVSCSEGLYPPSLAFSHVQASNSLVSLGLRVASKAWGNSPAGLDPQAQVLPAGFWFSVLARSQVHWPAGRARHEQRAPSTAFSEEALSHVQWRADCLPQEQVACLAVIQKETASVNERAIRGAMSRNSKRADVIRVYKMGVLVQKGGAVACRRQVEHATKRNLKTKGKVESDAYVS